MTPEREAEMKAVCEQLHLAGNQLREADAEISALIAAFEQHLGNTPGRCETTVMSRDKRMRLKLLHDGEAWAGRGHAGHADAVSVR